MRNIALILLLPLCLFARQKTAIVHPALEVPFEPWFAGPSLSPTAVNMEIGHPAIQPTLTVFNAYGRYNNRWKRKNQKNVWTVNTSVDFQFATSKNTGFEFLGSFSSNYRDGKSSTHLTDTIILFGYQLAHDQKGSWVPDSRLAFQTTFPTGKYKRLDRKKQGIDSTGDGAYFFGPNLSFQKLFYLPKSFFVLHWSLGYSIPTRAHIKGFSSYLGGKDTSGSLRPGNSFAAFLSGEYSLTQRWVLAFDTIFLHQGKSRSFRGTRGLNRKGRPAKVGLPTFVQMSFAPEIEYNFSPRLALVAGGWVTLFGRNAEAFVSAFIDIAYVF